MRFLRLTATAMMTCVLATSAFGSGFLIPEQGAKASAMAGAFAATADDPSAIFYNPAGIAQQREIAALAGTTLINFTNEFVGDPNSPVTSGVEAKYNRHTFNIPNMYAIYPIGQNLTVGVGVFAAFGLRTDWADPFPGRYISKDADLKTTSVQPTIAWQTSDGRFAVGGGVEYRRARVILNANQMRLNPFTGRITDVANTRLVSEYGSDIGFNAGILFKTASDRWRFGLAYRSAMDIDLEGDAEITQIPTGNAEFDFAVSRQLPPDQPINTTLPFPEIVSLAAAFSPNENWDFEIDIIRTGWDRFKALDVEFETTPAASFTREQNWEDSSSYRLGVNHNATEHWDVRFGFVYDENPQPVEAVSPLLPDSDRLGGSIGAGFHAGPFIIDGSLLVLHFKDRDTQGRNPEQFDGLYQTDALLWSVNLGYKF
ncbi:MAG TPA: outer membrane protein transport protein [Thermoanaerobaculia bacterium]|nr:outer membrane protein transport protein [Thermoanaerobaculia bacterium]